MSDSTFGIMFAWLTIGGMQAFFTAFIGGDWVQSCINDRNRRHGHSGYQYISDNQRIAIGTVALALAPVLPFLWLALLLRATVVGVLQFMPEVEPKPKIVAPADQYMQAAEQEVEKMLKDVAT